MEEYIRCIPDFPEPGIMFRDVTSVLQDAEGLKLAIDSMIKILDGVDFDVVVKGLYLWSTGCLCYGEGICPGSQEGKAAL